MDLRRLRAGEWLAAISGIALLVSLFLPWYGPRSVTGWGGMTAIDALLAFVAPSGCLVAGGAAPPRVPAVPVALSALISLVGSAGVILVLIRVLHLPGW